MKTKEIRKEIDATLTELLEVISTFDQGQINLIPIKGSWTAGQVAEHLVLSIAAFVNLMKGPDKKTERPPDEKEEGIKKTFLDFSIKLKSPNFIVPEEKYYQKEELQQILKSLKGELDKIIDTADLEKTCTAFEIPVIGHLTRLEGAFFVRYHTQRHIRQLRNIHQKLDSIVEPRRHEEARMRKEI